MDTKGKQYFESLQERPGMNSISNDKVTVASGLNHYRKTKPTTDHYATFACTTFLYVSAFSSTARESLTHVFRSLEHNVIFQRGTMPHILRNSPNMCCKGCV
jgi:hypothetical protein